MYLRSWQVTLFDAIARPIEFGVDDRTIHIVSDLTGNSGKSFLKNVIRLTYGDDIVFIHGRGSGTEYYVRTESGTTTSLTTTTDQDDWIIYRAYTSLFNAEEGTINSSISSINASFFDTWTDGQDIRIGTGTNVRTNNSSANPPLSRCLFDRGRVSSATGGCRRPMTNNSRDQKIQTNPDSIPLRV